MARGEVFQGAVQEFGKTTTGNTKVKIGGQWFYPGNCAIGEMELGQEVEVEWSYFGREGKLKGINGWGHYNGPRPAPNPDGPRAAREVLGGMPAPQKPPQPIDSDVLRFCSNTVAAALAANRIESPTDVAIWFNAAKQAALGIENEDKDIPF